VNRRNLFALAAMAIAALAIFAGPSAGSSTLPIFTCGQILYTNALLIDDLNCAAGPGVVVHVPGITIDLNGHVLKGGGSAPGIVNGGYDGVTVKNGTVRNFSIGADFSNGADNATVSNLVASGNGQGIYIAGASASIKSSNASGNGQSGVEIVGDSASITSTSAAGNGLYGVWVQGNGASIKSSRAPANAAVGFELKGGSTSVASSTASANGDVGLYVEGDSASVKSTKTSGNVNAGIVVSGDAATLKGNRAEGNGFPGGASDDVGVGILVHNFTIAPVGTNLARGNDDSAQCQPASLCLAAASKTVKAGWTPITTCGHLITTSAVLTQDLNCATQGIEVASSGITIDLNGHVLKGSKNGFVGILDNGYDGITIKNGVVRNFTIGLNAFNGADNVIVSNVVSYGNAQQGAVISGASASIKSLTTAGNGGDGIEVFDLTAAGGPSINSSTASGNAGSGIVVGGDNSSVQASTAAGNGAHGISLEGDFDSVESSSADGNADGISVQGDFASVVSSIASGNTAFGVKVWDTKASVKSTTAFGNGGNGIEVGGGGTLTGNRAEGNGFPGGVSDGAGLGIFVNVLGNAPLGANVSRGNDDPAQCSPASLC
jgi:Right handed beta helix region